MKFQLACGDVMPGCPTSFSAASQEQLFTEVASHAAAEHGITDHFDGMLDAFRISAGQVPDADLLSMP